MFIVFEGTEGCGKSTQAKKLADDLKKLPKKVQLIREPGTTLLGESIKTFFKDIEKINPISELFLFEAARAQLVNDVINPSLALGNIVICDRFYPSTLAYQAYARGIDKEFVTRCNDLATSKLVPDLIIWLKIPIEMGLERKSEDEKNFYERESLSFHKKVYDGYLSQERDSNNWFIVDGTASVEEVSKIIWDRIIVELAKFQ